jgi:membrane protein implicated in regulation of membrane protease activity
MSNPNNALSAWQLAVMAVVVVAVLAAWLVAVYLAAREPRRDGAAPPSPNETTGSAAAGTVHGQRTPVGAVGPRPHG